jgi:hypothetical protein
VRGKKESASAVVEKIYFRGTDFLFYLNWISINCFWNISGFGQQKPNPQIKMANTSWKKEIKSQDDLDLVFVK